MRAWSSRRRSVRGRSRKTSWSARSRA